MAYIYKQIQFIDAWHQKKSFPKWIFQWKKIQTKKNTPPPPPPPPPPKKKKKKKHLYTDLSDFNIYNTIK